MTIYLTDEVYKKYLSLSENDRTNFRLLIREKITEELQKIPDTDNLINQTV